MSKSERTSGVWVEDLRFVAGAGTLETLESNRTLAMSQIEVSNLYASREFVEDGFEDPRVVATKAAERDARLPDRLFQPGGYGNLTRMQQGVEYLVGK